MEAYLVRSIIVVSIILAVLLIVYVGCRLSDWLGHRAMSGTVVDAESTLEPLVFAKKPDRQAASLLVQARYLKHRLNALKTSKKPIAVLQQDVAAFAKDFASFLADNNVIDRKRGVVLKGYVSEIDNSLRSYSVYVPKSYDGSRPFPLLVSLHGHGWFGPFQGHPAPEFEGAIVLSPEGRGATDYMWIGEEDVLRALAEVRRDYAVDGSRVFLTGNSMGGTGAWQLAVHHPHLFAGIAPRAANCDFEAWRKRWGWSGDLEHQHRALRRYLLESDSPVTYLRNIAGMPVYVLHDAGDPVVPVEHARAAVERLHALGSPVEYREYMVGKHGGFSEGAVEDQIGWIAGHARTRAPRSYVYEARTLRHGRTAWVDIDQMDRVLEPARVDVALTDDALEIGTSNVLALVVRRERLRDLFGEGRLKLPVRIDGEPAIEIGLADRPIMFRRIGGAWRIVEDPLSDRALRKRPGLEGPVQDVALAPFTVVWGTGGGDAWKAAAREEAQRFVGEWKRRYGDPCRIHPDNELTPAMIADWNIVFFGRAAAASTMGDILERLPIRVDDRAVCTVAPTFLSADSGQAGMLAAPLEEFVGSDLGAIFCYPNPLAKDRLVAVHAAVTPGALYQVHTRFGNWFNWGVHDSRKWFDYAVYAAQTTNPETYPLVGFFGTDWSFERGQSWRSIREAVDAMLPQRFPACVEPPGAGVLYLSDLRPAKIDQMRGAVGFDRSFRGRPIAIPQVDPTLEEPEWMEAAESDGAALRCERGLGVRCPSAITWEIGGGFRAFRALVGFTLEPEEGLSADRSNREAARFVVIGDGEVLHAEEIDWTMPGVEIDVDVTGVKTLTLKVSALGGALWLHGSSAWGNARLEK